MFNLKDIVSRKKDLFDARERFVEARQEMREEFYETLKQYKLKVLKLEHLYSVNPLSDEVDILEKEAQAMFMRVGNLHKEMRNKYQELELKLLRAKENSKIFKK